MLENPFRVGHHVRGAFFTDRADELRIVLRTMGSGGRLLVWGPRRMGKSTVIGVAADRVRSQGGVVLSADLATVTSVAEAADRLLAAVSREERWHERLASWVRSLAPVVTLGADIAGRPRLRVALETRDQRGERERELLSGVIDRVDAVAAEHEQPVALVLDEVQQLGRIGGEAAEWLLRNRMQEHRHTAYVCAGSHESLVREMLQPKRAFYDFFEMLHVGPIDAEHLGRWIDDRLSGASVEARGVGPRVVDEAGPRTQDVLLVARTLWFRASAAGRASPLDVGAAIDEIVTAEDAALRRTWEGLSPLQQKVLRAVAAADGGGLHSEETRRRHDLGASLRFDYREGDGPSRRPETTATCDAPLRLPLPQRTHDRADPEERRDRDRVPALPGNRRASTLAAGRRRQAPGSREPDLLRARRLLRGDVRDLTIPG